MTELRKTAQERDAQIARLRELIAREESAVQLATSRAKDYASQRDSLTSQRDDAQQQLDALRSEADSIADDDGAALDAARATLSECRERLNELADKQREIQSKIISLKSKADALADTLGSRNASGSLERDTDVASLGRLTDFIHVAEAGKKPWPTRSTSMPAPSWYPRQATCCTPSNALGKISSAKPWC